MQYLVSAAVLSGMESERLHWTASSMTEGAKCLWGLGLFADGGSGGGGAELFWVGSCVGRSSAGWSRGGLLVVAACSSPLGS